ncbi:hypothetical protein [Arenibacterium sp. LLYu02]|uniref:hypothetical protein n=1 Tax=Arenibacterium sp. LLYu02 TaxID=3404132 RepID=UPI003B2273C5
MSVIDTHAGSQIRASTSGEPAIFFASNMDVNTDGASRSYHPDDPRGNLGIALNNMGNAISDIYDPSGRRITCSPRQGACYDRFIKTFEASRDADYAQQGYPRFTTDSMIPWRLDPETGYQKPCIGQNGYFVSQTAAIVAPDADKCDQRRYLDALEFNAIVLPTGKKWRSQGVVTDDWDLSVIIDAETGEVAFAINGDRGPRSKIGEGSVRLVTELGQTSVPDRATYRQIRELARAKVYTVIFPTWDIQRLTNRNGFTQNDVDRLGAEALAAFGGVERLRACIGG